MCLIILPEISEIRLESRVRAHSVWNKWKENVRKQKIKRKEQSLTEALRGMRLMTFRLSLFSDFTCVDAFTAQDQLNQGAARSNGNKSFVLHSDKCWFSGQWMRLKSGKAVDVARKILQLLNTTKSSVLLSNHSAASDLVGGSMNSVHPLRASSRGNAKGQAEIHKTQMMWQPSETSASHLQTPTKPPAIDVGGSCRKREILMPVLHFTHKQ